MMRTQLSICLLAAATQALNLTENGQNLNTLAQTGLQQSDACCCPTYTPCMPSCSNPCDDHDEHEGEHHIDLAEDVLKDVIPVGEEIIEDSGVRDIIADIVGDTEAGQIVRDIVTPIIDGEIINHEIDVDGLIDAIDEVESDMDIIIDGELPTTQDIID